MITEPRQYLVRLPVLVTAHDDGRVEYALDTSGAGDSIRGDDPATYHDDTTDAARGVRLRDAARVDADHRRRRIAGR